MNSAGIFAGAEGFPPGSLPVAIRDLQRQAYIPVKAGAYAAVAMLFIPPSRPDSRDAWLLLTRRSIKVGTHKGQIGFAGGRAEPEDRDPAATALREAEEELGIARERITVHGFLPPLPALDLSPVYPVVATAAISETDIIFATEEITALILEPWTSFKAQRSQPFTFNLFGIKRRSHLYSLPGNNVWGLTAEIITRADLR